VSFEKKRLLNLTPDFFSAATRLAAHDEMHKYNASGIMGKKTLADRMLS